MPLMNRQPARKSCLFINRFLWKKTKFSYEVSLSLVIETNEK